MALIENSFIGSALIALWHSLLGLWRESFLYSVLCRVGGALRRGVEGSAITRRSVSGRI